MPIDDRFSATRNRTRPVTLAAIVLGHALALYGLARVFAPDATAVVERAVLRTITVTVETKQYDPPRDPKPDPGAAGEAGRKAVPRPVVAPEPMVKVKPAPSAPSASSTGVADTSGATSDGQGAGAGGAGTGTGSGTGGGGQGAGLASKPVLLSGAINNARDYPIPSGGRQARIGTEVIVRVTVGTDGRASNCTVYKPSPDPQADAITCRLVVERLRFRPATDSNGNPRPAPFYWRQRWF